MRTYLFALLLTLFTLPTTAQEFEIDWGKDFDSKAEIEKILGFTSQGMVAYSTKGGSRYISLFDAGDFAEKSSFEFTLPKLEKRNSELLDLVITGENVSAILYIYEKKTKSFSLYTQVYNLNGKIIGSPEKLYQSEVTDGKIREMKVEMRLSPGEEKAMVYFDRKNKETTVLKTDVVIMDVGETLTKIGESTHTFDVKDTKNAYVYFNVFHGIEDDGTFSIIRERARFIPTVKASFTMMVGRYKPTGEEIGVAKIEKDNHAFVSPTMITLDDKIIVTGYAMADAHEKENVLGYTSVFYAELDLDMSVKKIVLQKLPNDFFIALLGERVANNKIKSGREMRIPTAYKMKDIIVHSDGSITLLSEYYTVQVSTSGNQTTTLTTYGPILYFKFDADGNLTGSDKIQKLQRSAKRSSSLGVGGAVTVFVTVSAPDKKLKYWSYAAVVSGDHVYLVYNDHFKNQMRSDADEKTLPMQNPKKSVPYLVTIKPDGSYRNKSMVGSGDTETYAVPQVTYQNGNKSFVIWGVWRKMNKFGQAIIMN